jgi:hypothetical protein
MSSCMSAELDRMSLAPLKGIRGCWGMEDVAGRQLLETIGPACALHAPVRQDGLDRDRVAK